MSRAAPSRPGVPSGDHPADTPGKASKHCLRAERRATPSRPAVPSGDRPAYTPGEGPT